LPLAPKSTERCGDFIFPGKMRHDPSFGHPPFRGLWSVFCLRESGDLKRTFPGASIVYQWNFLRHRQSSILSVDSSVRSPRGPVVQNCTLQRIVLAVLTSSRNCFQARLTSTWLREVYRAIDDQILHFTSSWKAAMTSCMRARGNKLKEPSLCVEATDWR